MYHKTYVFPCLSKWINKYISSLEDIHLDILFSNSKSQKLPFFSQFLGRENISSILHTLCVPFLLQLLLVVLHSHSTR